jgi:hypothetical protein
MSTVISQNFAICEFISTKRTNSEARSPILILCPENIISNHGRLLAMARSALTSSRFRLARIWPASQLVVFLEVAQGSSAVADGFEYGSRDVCRI